MAFEEKKIWDFGFCKPFFLLILFVFLGNAQSTAQSILVSEPLSMRSDYGYELIGHLRDRFLLFRDKFDNFEVQAYDQRLQFSWNKEIEDIDKRGTQILAVIGSKNDFSVIFKSKRKGVSSLRIHKYDPAANLIDSMTIKTYSERYFVETLTLDILKSEDKNVFVAYNASSHNEIEATCFRIDRMKMLWDTKIPIDNGDLESNFRHLALSNSGAFFLVQEQNNRRNKIEEHFCKIKYISPNIVGEKDVPLPQFLTNDVLFTFDNQNNCLVGAGLYGEKTRERANGIFSLKMSLSDAMPKVTSTPFDDRFISIFRGKEVEADTKGIGDAKIQQIALRKDGGIVVVAEQLTELARGAAQNRSMMRDGMRLIIDYYYNDFFVIALNPDGKPHWKTVLHKKQYSQDDEATFSSFFMFKSKDSLRFLFNDEVKYENTCSEYVVNALGEFDRNSLLSTENQNLRLRFRDGVQLNANECLVPSEYRNKLRLVLLRY